MAIRTGLSVTVCGCAIRLQRDEAAKLARVVVDRPADGRDLTKMEVHAVNVAAELLARRAVRFLGDWRVTRLPKVW